MYTSTSKQQGRTFKDSYSKFFITTNFDKFHREAVAKGGERGDVLTACFRDIQSQRSIRMEFVITKWLFVRHPYPNIRLLFVRQYQRTCAVKQCLIYSYGDGFKVYSYGIRSGAVRITNLLASYGKYSFAGRQGILDNVFCVFLPLNMTQFYSLQ